MPPSAAPRTPPRLVTSAPPLVPAAAGWVVPSVSVLLAGAAWTLGAAWRHLLPDGAPAEWAVLVACLAVGLPAFALAVSFAAHPGRPPDIWRPAIALAVVGAGAAAAATVPQHRLATTLLAAVVVALVVRTAETLGRHLAPVMVMGNDDSGAEHAAEARRAVLEVWLGCALAFAAAGRPAHALLIALTLVAGAGLTIAGGAHMAAADAVVAAEDYVWQDADRAQAWRGMAALGVLGLAIALAVPGAPAVVHGGLWIGPIRLLLSLVLGASGHHPRAPAPATHIVLPLPVVRPKLPAGGGTSGLLPFFRDLRVLVEGYGAYAAVLVLLYGYLRHVFDPHGDDWLAPFRTLWQGCAALWAFLRDLLWALRSQPPGPQRHGAVAARRAVGETATVRRPPADRARRALRAAYRRYLAAGVATGRPRQPAESPGAYARRTGPALGPAKAEADRLTAVYEEVRFSPHRIPHPAVRAGLRAMRLAVAALRNARVAGQGGGRRHR